MHKTLKKINILIRDARSDNFSSISYNKYYRDLSHISDSIIDEIPNNTKLLMEIHKLPNSQIKTNLLDLLNHDIIMNFINILYH